MSAEHPTRSTLVARLERASIGIMALGIALLLQPWWESGMRVGFFVTAFGTLMQIVFAHVPESNE